VSTCILDASALLAYLQGEDGETEVADAVAKSAAMSAANWAETLSKTADAGQAPSDLAAALEEQGLLPGLIEIVPLTAEDALAIAEIRLRTGRRDLSLADRACLALGLRLGLPVLTADREWFELDDVDVTVRSIRH
jgi:ribonuclease VapC